MVLLLSMTWVLGCGITTRLIGPPLEGAEVSLDELPNADAIVLLGGSMGAHEKCGRAEIFSGADRVWAAARLWKAGKAPKMTLSGGSVKESTVPFLRDLGVEESSIMYFPDARNTEEEAAMIAATGVKRILLVTSAWHMPRAKMLFERSGFEVIPAPTDYEMTYCAELKLELGEFFPSANGLMQNSIAIKEWVALFGYSMFRRRNGEPAT